MSWFDDSDVPRNLKQDSRRLYEYFESRRVHVVCVKCLYNFRMQDGVCSGLCVQIKPTYELSASDRIWLHADHHRSTTVAQCNISEETFRSHEDTIREGIWDVPTPAGDHDFGLYVERTKSDYSAEDACSYMCVTTNHARELLEVPLQGTVDTWVANVRTMISAVDLCERNMERITALFPKATCLSHKETNIFIRDNTTWRYINYAHNVQPTESHVFVRVHPSVGYERFSMEPREGPILVPSDMGVCKQICALEEMTEERAKHMKSTHWWDSTQVVHMRAQQNPVKWSSTFPMRKMRIFNPNSIRVIAVKLGDHTRGLTLEEGWALSKKSKVQYDFGTVHSTLTLKSLKLFKDSYVHGHGFALTKCECDEFGVQT